MGLLAVAACAGVGLGGVAKGGTTAGTRPTPDRRPVPILMYHVIAEPPAAAPLPRPVRAATGAPGAGSLARGRGLRSRDARTGVRCLAGPNDVASAPRRAVVRRRLQEPRHGGVADPRSAAVARHVEPRSLEPRACVGDRRPRCAQATRCGVGDRRSFPHTRGPRLSQRRGARPRGERLTAPDPATVRCAAALLLLPGRAIRRGDFGRGESRGLRRRYHDGARSRPIRGSRSRSPASVSDAATEPPAWRGSSPPSACPSTEVAGPLLVGENPVRRVEPSFAERDELVDTAAELARPATDDAVLLTRDNGSRVAVEADRGERFRWAVEIATRPPRPRSRGAPRSGRP